MKEETIRPQELFDQYLKLAKQDVKTYFSDAFLQNVPCPSCGERNSLFLFRKLGFDYEECQSCGTLFVNPRPTNDTFKIFYQDSSSVNFWATHFYKETENARRQEIIRPKAVLVKSFIDKYYDMHPSNPAIIDIGAGYGVFCEEIKQIVPDEISVIAVEPAKALQEICAKKGLITLPKFMEEVQTDDLGDYSVIAATSFELLEHLYDPQAFIKDCKKILLPGSLLILTTLNWHGFDLQVLREKSKSIYPPHHINFFTTQSVCHLLEKNGFSICEVITPGKLDVDIVSKQIGDVNDMFIRRLVSADDIVRQKFQIFLQDAGMSSHMMIVAKMV